METRANYVLIGAVTLLGIVGVLAFFLWYAKVQIDRTYDYYDIFFDQVTGLNRAADVRFNGIAVGQVITITLDLVRTAKVRVRIEVAEGTPIRADTIATLQSQGVTGVSFVALAGGVADAPPLDPPDPGGVAVIQSEPSVLDTIIETAPQLLREATELLRELSGFVGVENQRRVSEILSNVETASSGLETALSDFSAISGTVREGVAQISAFTGRLDGIASTAETTLRTANTTLGSATVAFDEAQGALASATGALDAARTTFQSADALIVGRLPGLVDGYEAVARSAETTIDGLGVQAGGLIGRLDTAADLAAARLREAEAPLAAATPALAAVESAAVEFETLTDGDGTALVNELRTAVDAANRLLETDAGPILADVRAAAATVNRVIGEVGGDVTALSGRLDGVVAQAGTTLADAAVTFRTATATLGAIEPALATAERTLTAAESAFASADAVMNQDIEPIVADIRAAVARFDAAMAQVSADLPAISAEVRGAATSASAAAARFETMVGRSAPGVESFAATGLTQFTRLGGDARTLVAALERLIQRIERDPARFFLGGQSPEYRP